MKTLVGCCFQRTTKPNRHKIIFRQKAFSSLLRHFFLPNIGAMAIAPYLRSLSAKLSFLPIFINGALENSTLRIFYE